MIPAPDPHSTTAKKCSASDSKLSTEDESDEIRIFSASSVQKNEPDADTDERLSPVIEEPTSPQISNSVYNHLPEFYPFPLLYPYLLSAAAQVKSPFDIPTSHLFGNVPRPAFPFPGMPFPCGAINETYAPHLFNPYSMSVPASQTVSVVDKQSRAKKPHIKKPLNAFMIFMKEQRAHLIEDSTLKESSAINKLLGQKWKELSRTEQDRYYALAKEERNRHLQMYPNWSARDNYGLKKKKATGRVEKQAIHKSKTSAQLDSDPKKCRARYGLEGIHHWCKHCRRKKKCTRFLDDEMIDGRTLSNTISSPSSSHSDNEDILSRQIDSIEDDHNDSNEENKQRFPLKVSTMSPYFTSHFLS